MRGAVRAEHHCTDEEKQQLQVAAANFSLNIRFFLASLFSCLDYSDNDYFQLFAICPFYTMQVTCNQTLIQFWNFGINWEEIFLTFGEEDKFLAFSFEI